MTSTTIHKTVFFNATPDVVWSFLTDKDKLGTWYHLARADLSEGEDYELFETSDDGSEKPIVTGKVIEMASPHKLVTTFYIGPFGDNTTTLTWVLEAFADGTRLSLKHEGIAEAVGEGAVGLLMALDKGWDEHFARLRTNAN
ncbi:MAG: SRPBCC domain-containing protein [Rhizobiaceae bacterium]|nr:SRPBCC domain-containing protein [Rhizobiaceae bacterium]